jgi:hypothetical protein
MLDSKLVGTPSEAKKLACNVTEDNDITRKVPFQEAVGSMLFLFVVNDVSRFYTKHSTTHRAAVKRIFRYLRGTVTLKLMYTDTKTNELKVFCDADWASD